MGLDHCFCIAREGPTRAKAPQEHCIRALGPILTVETLAAERILRVFSRPAREIAPAELFANLERTVAVVELFSTLPAARLRNAREGGNLSLRVIGQTAERPG